MDENMIKAACEASDRVVAGVTPSQFDLATPCSEWNVRDLSNHLLSTLHLGRALLSDEMPTVKAGPGEVPEEDLIGGDLIGAYRAGAKALLAAATPEAIERPHATPLGEMPGVGLAGFTALDVLVHGWDLAKATGQEMHIDPELAEQVLDFARQAIGDDIGMRAPRIGPAVTVAAEADATARLVGYLGREP